MDRSMLSSKERENLHLALLAYLEVQGFDKTKNAFRDCAGVTKKTDRSHRKIIAENWRAIVKLRRKITTLEEKNKQLKEDIDNFGVVKEDSDPLPKKPARYCFSKQSNVITCVKFHPKYPSVASSSEDASIVIYNADSGAVEQQLRGHQDAVNCIAWHPKKNMIASCSADMSIKFWDIDDGKCTKTVTGHDHNVSCVVFAQDGKFLLSCSRDKTIKKTDTVTGACKATIKGHKDWVRYLAVSPDKKHFASCSTDQLIKIWTIRKGECEITIGGEDVEGAHSDVIETLCYTNFAADQIIIKHLLKDDVKAEEKKLFQERKQLYADLEKTDPGGAFLISGGRDKKINIYSSNTGKIVFTINGAHDNWVRGLCMHPTGKYFLSCSDDKSIKVWNLEKGGSLENKMDTCHELFVTSIDWCSSMDFLASGGVDNKVNVWNCKP